MKKAVRLVISVDWEGLSLESRNLERLREFKKRWAIPMVHYMNPAYFTHPELKNQAESFNFKEIVRFDDQWGLHLHAPKHLVSACGIDARIRPSFAVSGDANPGEMKGQEVMLHSYQPEEFEKLIQFSFDQFLVHGLPLPTTFRAGGWMLEPAFFSILQQWGIKTDSSSAPASHLKGTCWEGENLQRYMEMIWKDVEWNSQPQKWTEGFVHIPNNFGAIDYWKNLDGIIEQVNHLENNDVAVITLHQETAEEYLPLLDQLFKSLGHLDLQFITCREIFDNFHANPGIQPQVFGESLVPSDKQLYS